MKPVKTLAAVGLSDAVRGELEAMIERTAPRLAHTWRWGSEQSPDALLLDPNDPAGGMARTRAVVTGVRFITVIDFDDPEPTGLYLRRPFRSQALIEVLEAAATATVTGSELAYQNDEGYFDEIERFHPASSMDGAATPPEATPADQTRGKDAPIGLDEMIRGDPLVEPEPDPGFIRSDTGVVPREGGHGGSARAEIRRSEAFGRIGERSEDDPPVDAIPMPGHAPPAPGPASGPAATSEAGAAPGHALVEFLEGDILRGPSRLELDDAPPLSLDPKLKLFHASGDLSRLAPYCRRGLPQHGWRALTTSELARVREAERPRSYADLKWLCALLKGDGRLASRLDPGGSFAIGRRVAIDPEFHGHGPIADALAQPARLHEVAASSGRPMAEVFDVVNAYDAIGQLQWTPRAPRHVEATPASPRPKGLLGGLRWPFGKR